MARWLLLAVLAVGAVGKVSYKDNKVLRVAVGDEGVRDVLRGEMEKGHVSGLDFWSEPVVGKEVDVRVPPKAMAHATELLASHGLTYKTVTDDLEPLLAAQTANRTGYRAGQPLNFDYFEYHTYEEIIDWMHDMERQYHGLVTLVNMGKSYEGRELLAMKVTGSPDAAVKKEKPSIFTNYAIHAREWLSPASCLFIVHELLSGYTTSGEIRFIVDNIDWTFLPVTNPDGYVYSWDHDRMWRKTRSPNQGSDCVGTDPNRNWGFEWGGSGASTNPCSDSYMGPSAFSEIEVSTLGDYLKNLGPDGYIDVHCCGAMWMSPWGYTTQLPPAKDYELQMDANEQCVNAIKAVSGTQYAYGTISRVIYVASGSSVDYVYGDLESLYSVAVELPGSFTSPASAIQPTAIEMWTGLKEFAFVVLNENGKK